MLECDFELVVYTRRDIIKVFIFRGSCEPVELLVAECSWSQIWGGRRGDGEYYVVRNQRLCEDYPRAGVVGTEAMTSSALPYLTSTHFALKCLLDLTCICDTHCNRSYNLSYLLRAVACPGEIRIRVQRPETRDIRHLRQRRGRSKLHQEVNETTGAKLVCNVK